MADLKKDISDENLTQKDIVQLLLHNAQHMVTREDLKSDIKELKDEIKADIKELKEDLKSDIRELKQDMSKLEVNIAYLSTKFDRMQWLIVTAILSIFLKDYLLAFIQS